METVNSEESLGNTDVIVSDTIFKIALKKIKSLFNLQTDQNTEQRSESEKASKNSRDGSEEHREQESQKWTI